MTLNKLVQLQNQTPHFKRSTRKANDTQRMKKALKGIEGKSLSPRELMRG